MSEPEPTHGEPGPGHRRRTAGPPLQTPSPAPNRTRTPDQGLRPGSRRLDPARTLTDPGPHRRGITGEHRLESAPASPGAAGGRRPRTECHEPEDRIAEPAPTPRLDVATTTAPDQPHHHRRPPIRTEQHDGRHAARTYAPGRKSPRPDLGVGGRRT